MTRKCEEVQTFVVRGCYGDVSPLQLKVYTGSGRIELWHNDSRLAYLHPEQAGDFLEAVAAAYNAASKEAIFEAESRVREQLRSK